MIHVCYALYDKDGHYSKFVGTSIASLFDNTNKPVTVHILHDNTLTSDNRDKFTYLAGCFGQKIVFYNVEILADAQLDAFKNKLIGGKEYHYSIASLYRLLLPSFIKSVPKMIYLDADTLVNCDISDLWNINITEYALAAVPEFACGIRFTVDKYLITSGEVVGDDYFNSGVLLINLKYLREHEDDIWQKGFAFVISHPQCRYLDQDILNYCFSKNYVKLTSDFNRFVDVERIHRKPCTVKPHIYHFLSGSLKADLDDCFNRLYFEYFIKTPWFDIETIGNFFKFVDGANKLQQNAMLGMIRLLGKKRRVFFTEETNIPAIRALFEIAKDELVINASKTDALMKLYNALKTHKTVCFIFSGNYLGFKNFLVSQHFVEGQDFVNAIALVSGLIGIPTDSHSIIRAM